MLLEKNTFFTQNLEVQSVMLNISNYINIFKDLFRSYYDLLILFLKEEQNLPQQLLLFSISHDFHTQDLWHHHFLSHPPNEKREMCKENNKSKSPLFCWPLLPNLTPLSVLMGLCLYHLSLANIHMQHNLNTSPNGFMRNLQHKDQFIKNY